MFHVPSYGDLVMAGPTQKVTAPDPVKTHPTDAEFHLYVARQHLPAIDNPAMSCLAHALLSIGESLIALAQAVEEKRLPPAQQPVPPIHWPRRPPGADDGHGLGVK